MNMIHPSGLMDLSEYLCNSSHFELEVWIALTHFSNTHSHTKNKREKCLSKDLCCTVPVKNCSLINWMMMARIYQQGITGQGNDSLSAPCLLQKCAVNLQGNNYESFQEDKGRTLFPKSNKPDSRTPSWGWKMFPWQLRLSCMLVFLNWHARQAISFHHRERMQFQGSYPPILCNSHKGRRNVSWET